MSIREVLGMDVNNQKKADEKKEDDFERSIDRLDNDDLSDSEPKDDQSTESNEESKDDKPVEAHEGSNDDKPVEAHEGPNAGKSSKMINLITYGETEYDEKDIELDKLKEMGILLERKPGSNLWVNVDKDFDDEAVGVICEIFDIHPLVKEDVTNRRLRPKIEDYDDYTFTVAKMIYFQEEEMILEQVSFIMGEDYVITFGEVEGDVFDDIRNRLKKKGSLLRKSGADYLFYTLLDAIVDGYFDTLENIGEKLDNLEEKVISTSSQGERQEIRKLKKELLYIHKFAWPLREVMSWVGKGDSSLIKESTQIYFRDIYNMLVQVIDTTETYRELLTGLVELNLSNVSYRLNEVMKVLTIISTIFIPLTFLAGVYGMNFKYMPELYLRWSYPLLWVIMLLIASTMMYYFKKKKWF